MASFSPAIELGIGFMPYSPLGKRFPDRHNSRGHGSWRGDLRKNVPRFRQEAMEKNRAFVDPLQRVGTRPALLRLR